MHERDKTPFGRTLIGAFEVYGRQAPSADALRVWWGILQPHSLTAIQQAMDRYARTEPQYPPTPAKILALLGEGAGDNRPEADEAWSIALRATDEAATVVWTDEIAQAMAAAQPVLDAGDEIGARMAFKAAYARLTSAARAARQPVRWVASVGTNKQQAEEVVAQAVAQNLLPAPSVAGLLPAPGSFSDDVDEVTAAENLTRLRGMVGAAISTPRSRRPTAEDVAAAKRADEQVHIDQRVREDQARTAARAAAGEPDDLWPSDISAPSWRAFKPEDRRRGGQV